MLQTKKIMLTTKTIVSNKHPLYNYFVTHCSLTKNLKNAVLFRLRQNFTARNKDVLSVNEKEVQEEIQKTIDTLSLKRPKSVISYGFMEKMMRITENPDFFAGLPMQTSQQILKQTIGDFKNWLSALKIYHQSPSSFLGKPKMPNYQKKELTTTTFTNQDCIIKEGMLKFPFTKETLKIQNLTNDCTIKEVKVKPYYGQFMVLVTYEKEVSFSEESKPFIAAIDFGVNNLVSLINNKNSCTLYKGGSIKAMNQWYNKEKARLTSCLEKYQKTSYVNTNHLHRLSTNRDLFLKDYFHKVTSDIINQCKQENIGILVVGKNKEWKQHSNIGKTNNQNFVSIPFHTLEHMLQYKAEMVGITVLFQEESYTSKASFLDNDEIPTYDKSNNETPSFSGKRITRGLYKSKDGDIINADLNGAGNILRKAFPNAFDNVNKKDILNNIIVKNIHSLNAKK